MPIGHDLETVLSLQFSQGLSFVRELHDQINCYEGVEIAKEVLSSDNVKCFNDSNWKQWKYRVKVNLSIEQVSKNEDKCQRNGTFKAQHRTLIQLAKKYMLRAKFM